MVYNRLDATSKGIQFEETYIDILLGELACFRSGAKYPRSLALRSKCETKRTQVGIVLRMPIGVCAKLHVFSFVAQDQLHHS